MIEHKEGESRIVEETINHLNRSVLAYNNGLLSWEEFREQLSFELDRSKLISIRSHYEDKR